MHDGLHADGGGEVGLAGAGTADEDDVVRLPVAVEDVCEDLNHLAVAAGVLEEAHLGPGHLSAAAQRIERVWSVVDGGSTISLRETA